MSGSDSRPDLPKEGWAEQEVPDRNMAQLRLKVNDSFYNNWFVSVSENGCNKNSKGGLMRKLLSPSGGQRAAVSRI